MADRNSTGSWSAVLQRFYWCRYCCVLRGFSHLLTKLCEDSQKVLFHVWIWVILSIPGRAGRAAAPASKWQEQRPSAVRSGTARLTEDASPAALRRSWVGADKARHGNEQSCSGEWQRNAELVVCMRSCSCCCGEPWPGGQTSRPCAADRPLLWAFGTGEGFFD